MQIIKERYKSDLHNLLEILNKRMTLEDEYRKILVNYIGTKVPSFWEHL